MSDNYIFREAKIPLPIEKQKAGQSWVSWGDNNDYPQFLIGLYYNSSIHGGIVNSKVKYIASSGLDAQTNDLPKWELIKKNGNAPFSLDEISLMVAKDFELLDSFAILFKKNPISKFWDAHHVSTELIRKGEDSSFFYYSENWKERNQTEEKTGFKKIKNIEDLSLEDKECLLYVSSRSKQHIIDEKTGLLTKSVYPIPSYSGAIKSIMASIEMNYFRYSEVVNSFKGGTMINIPTGAPDNEHDKKKLIAQLKGDATDRDKQGGIVVTFSRGSENAPTVTQINGNNLDQRYLLTQESIIDDIMVGHSVISPTLFSIKTAGQLGGSQELETAYQLFMNNYALERQKIITDALEYAHYTLNNFYGDIFFISKPLSLSQEPDSKSIVADSLNKMSPLLANAVLKNLTINEQRALAGLAPLPNGDVIASTPTTFSSELSDENVISWFSELGRTDYKEVFSQEVKDFTKLEMSEKELLSKYSFANDLTQDQLKIVEMINNGESYGAIVKAIDKGATYVSRQLVELEKLGMIKGFELTPKGKTNVGEVSFEVVYQYREREGIPPLKGNSSRPFCKNLIDLKRVFTRDEIDQITARLKANGIDRDVWQYKGGWYHNPETNRNTPSCRHTWFQVIINK
ncbi:hypothetical protein UFOVP603_20 [uncultured Caudovirales phage]|uniref:Uncharacterized protein n=1 Tax=uncultured Caudovirales phage TaxID=2100421 RepID=A0A6J5N1R9_9CAUD|nr:hypothetical protein UFOVP603_20 [uncultured Caudovirales phage]